MTHFTAGTLTASQAAELNDLQRKVAALLNMTATHPLTVNRGGGALNLSIAPQAAVTSDEFDAMITDFYPPTPTGSGNNSTDPTATLYSWHKMVWQARTTVVNGVPTPDAVQVPDPAGVKGTYNLKRNPSNTPFITITPPPPRIPRTNQVPQPWFSLGQVVRIKPMPGVAGLYVTDAVGGITNGYVQTWRYYQPTPGGAIFEVLWEYAVQCRDIVNPSVHIYPATSIKTSSNF